MTENILNVNYLYILPANRLLIEEKRKIADFGKQEEEQFAYNNSRSLFLKAPKLALTEPKLTLTELKLPFTVSTLPLTVMAI